MDLIGEFTKQSESLSIVICFLQLFDPLTIKMPGRSRDWHTGKGGKAQMSTWDVNDYVPLLRNVCAFLFSEIMG